MKNQTCARRAQKCVDTPETILSYNNNNNRITLLDFACVFTYAIIYRRQIHIIILLYASDYYYYYYQCYYMHACCNVMCNMSKASVDGRSTYTSMYGGVPWKKTWDLQKA